VENITALQIVTYLLILAVIVAFAARLYRYYKMPTHLRWELYPLASEKKRTWGGSYLEEPEWWKKPPEEKSLVGEAAYITEEILLFREYFRKKRDYWYLVYPFHISIYLLVGFLGLLFIGGVTIAAGQAVAAESAGVWGRIVYYLTLIVGGVSFIVGILSGIGLFIRRLVDPDLKIYTKRGDYFNLLAVTVVFLTGFFAWVLTDINFAIAREYAHGLITFSGVGNIPAITAVHIVLLLLVGTYIPFTGMMHFFAKTFTYHFVRWEDAPHMSGNKLEQKLVPLLNQEISWSAPHMQTIRRWSDIVQETALEGAGEEHSPRIQKGESS